MTSASPSRNALVKLGFVPGKIDGVLGHDVKAALRLYQKSHEAFLRMAFRHLISVTAMLTEIKAKDLEPDSPFHGIPVIRSVVVWSHFLTETASHFS